MGIEDWSVTAGNNTTLEGVSWAEGMDPGAVNDGQRAIAAAIKAAVGYKGANIASSSSIDLGAATGQFVDVSGTTTITSLGTVDAGTWRIVRFTGALTLTHNATSLILPYGQDFTTAAGDFAAFLSLGSGNWVMAFHQRAGNPTISSTDAGATVNPILTLHRDSASPAASDEIGAINFDGEDDGGNQTTYARIHGFINDPTGGSEDGGLIFETLEGATLTKRLTMKADGDITLEATSPLLTNGLTSITGLATGVAGTDGVAITNVSLHIQRGNGANRFTSKPTGYSDNKFDDFRVNGTSVGNISTDGSGTTYSTTSDEKTKNLKGEMSRAEVKAAAKTVRVKKFTFKNDPDAVEQHGVTAQSLEAVMPEAVVEVDGVKQVSIGHLATLALAIAENAQDEVDELREENDDLRAQMAALLTRVEALEAR